MTAVARELSPPRPRPRLVPPRPAPRSVPPPLPVSTEVDDAEVLDVSETAVHVFAPEEVAAPPPIALAPTTTHPGLVLVRTLGFFVAQIARDARAYVAAHWVRASARARS